MGVYVRGVAGKALRSVMGVYICGLTGVCTFVGWQAFHNVIGVYICGLAGKPFHNVTGMYICGLVGMAFHKVIGVYICGLAGKGFHNVIGMYICGLVVKAFYNVTGVYICGLAGKAFHNVFGVYIYGFVVKAFHNVIGVYISGLAGKTFHNVFGVYICGLAGRVRDKALQLQAIATVQLVINHGDTGAQNGTVSQVDRENNVKIQVSSANAMLTWWNTLNGFSEYVAELNDVTVTVLYCTVNGFYWHRRSFCLYF